MPTVLKTNIRVFKVYSDYKIHIFSAMYESTRHLLFCSPGINFQMDILMSMSACVNL